MRVINFYLFSIAASEPQKSFLGFVYFFPSNKPGGTFRNQTKSNKSCNGKYDSIEGHYVPIKRSTESINQQNSGAICAE